MVLGFFKRLKDIGLYEDMDRLDAEKTQVVNVMFIASVTIFSYYFIKNIIERDIGFASFYVLCVVLSLVILIFNHHRIYLAAQVYSILFYTSLCLGLLYFFGSGTGIEAMFLVFVVMAAYIIDNRITAIFIVAIIALGFIAMLYMEQFRTPVLAHRVMILSPVSLFVAAVFIISSFIFDRRNKTERYIQEHIKFEAELKNKNIILGEQKELIATQNEELEKKNHELNQFAYIAAHDLKSPIRGIKSFAQLARVNLEKENYNKVADFLTTITDNTSHLHDLIQDLLSYSLLEKDAIELEFIDLNEVFKSAELLVNDKLARSIVLKSEELPLAMVNPLQFKLLFQNIIENGIKYNKAEVPELIIKASKSNGYHIISFKDNGIGIDGVYQEQIFDMFKRLHSTTEFEGSGLGLAICKKIIERHCGTISIAESSDQGSTFIIRWPIVQSNDPTRFHT